MASRAHVQAVLLVALTIVAMFSVRPAQAAQCGWHSGNYARTCSSHAAAGCLRAAKRKVAGFSVSKCRAEAALCSKCLASTLACAKRVDRPERSKAAVAAGCRTCDSGFGRCMGKT